MTRAEHYAKAEKYLASLDKMDKDLAEADSMLIHPNAAAQINASRDYMMRRAQIHATLASAQIEGNPS